PRAARAGRARRRAARLADGRRLVQVLEVRQRLGGDVLHDRPAAAARASLAQRLVGAAQELGGLGVVAVEGLRVGLLEVEPAELLELDAGDRALDALDQQRRGAAAASRAGAMTSAWLTASGPRAGASSATSSAMAPRAAPQARAAARPSASRPARTATAAKSGALISAEGSSATMAAAACMAPTT